MSSSTGGHLFLFGWLQEEVLGEPVEVLLPHAIRERHAEVHRKGFMADPYTRAMGANLDLMAQHKDGWAFPVLIDLHPEVGSDGIYVRAAIRRKDDQSPSDEPVASAVAVGPTCPFGGGG